MATITDDYFTDTDIKRMQRMVKKINAIEAVDAIDRDKQAAAYVELDEFTPVEQAYVIRELDKLASERYPIIEPEGGFYVPPKPEPAPAPVAVTPRVERKRREKINDGEVKLLGEAILSILKDAKNGMTKGEIVKNLGGEAPKASVWNKAIASIDSKIQSVGKKRGTRYALAGKKVTIKRLMPQDDVVTGAKAQILDALREIDAPAGRSQVFETIGRVIPQDVWMMAVAALIDEGRVTKTGVKRGAKYEVK